MIRTVAVLAWWAFWTLLNGIWAIPWMFVTGRVEGLYRSALWGAFTGVKMGEMKQKRVLLERTVIHPVDFGMYHFLDRILQFVQVVIGRVSVDYDPKPSAVLVESRDLGLRNLYRVINQRIVDDWS